MYLDATKTMCPVANSAVKSREGILSIFFFFLPFSPSLLPAPSPPPSSFFDPKMEGRLRGYPWILEKYESLIP